MGFALPAPPFVKNGTAEGKTAQSRVLTEERPFTAKSLFLLEPTNAFCVLTEHDLRYDNSVCFTAGRFPAPTHEGTPHCDRERRPEGSASRTLRPHVTRAGKTENR